MWKDDNCGYPVVTADLNYIGRDCKDTVKDVRIYIWYFASNRKYYHKSLSKEHFYVIYLEKLKYIGRIGHKHWIGG